MTYSSSVQNTSLLTLPHKIQNAFLKIFLACQIHDILCDSLQLNITDSTELYMINNKILQFLIHSIIDTNEYTLEGIAYYTRIPFDVLYDAACGISTQFSITSWSKLIDLYMQVKPNITTVLIEKLIEIKNKNPAIFSILLNKAS